VTEEGAGDEVTVELRIVARQDGYHPLHREILPLAGITPATMPADLQLVVRHEELVGYEKLPLLFVVSPQVRIG